MFDLASVRSVDDILYHFSMRKQHVKVSEGNATLIHEMSSKLTLTNQIDLNESSVCSY